MPQLRCYIRSGWEDGLPAYLGRGEVPVMGADGRVLRANSVISSGKDRQSVDHKTSDRTNVSRFVRGAQSCSASIARGSLALAVVIA